MASPTRSHLSFELPSAPSGKPGEEPFLLVEAQDRICAFRLRDVVEVSRPLPLKPLLGLPSWTLGMAVYRGGAVPVVDLAGLLGGGEGSPGSKRYAVLRLGSRKVALALDEVLGIRALDPDSLERLPPLLCSVSGDVVEAVGVLDREFHWVLDSARLIPEGFWQALERHGGEG